jgi:serine/threonine protein kinase
VFATLTPEYKFLKKIGKGASARVYKIMRREDKKVFAVKMIRIKDWEMNDLEQEITVMSSCKHKNIVQYYETFLYNE